MFNYFHVKLYHRYLTSLKNYPAYSFQFYNSTILCKIFGEKLRNQAKIDRTGKL